MAEYLARIRGAARSAGQSVQDYKQPGSGGVLDFEDFCEPLDAQVKGWWQGGRGAFVAWR